MPSIIVFFCDISIQNYEPHSYLSSIKITTLHVNRWQSKGTFHNRNIGQSKVTACNRSWTIGPFSKKIVKIYVSQVVHWTIVQIDNTKLRLTGGQWSHCANGQCKITSHSWFIGQISKWKAQIYVSQVVH